MLRPVCLLLFGFAAILAGAQGVAARFIFDGFSKPPTFTPPPGCVPTAHAYGVVAECAKELAPGRSFTASTETSVGWGAPAHEFLEDKIMEIRQWWLEKSPPNTVTFSSKASAIVPGNAPQGILCAEFSVTVKTDERVQRTEGITCSWPVANPKPHSWTVETCLLEAYDAYKPPLGQKPMPSFDRIAHELFLSMRLQEPATKPAAGQTTPSKPRTEWTDPLPSLNKIEECQRADLQRYLGSTYRFHLYDCWADVSIDANGLVTAFKPDDADACERVLATKC